MQIKQDKTVVKNDTLIIAIVKLTSDTKIVQTSAVTHINFADGTTFIVIHQHLPTHNSYFIHRSMRQMFISESLYVFYNTNM